VGFQSGAQAEAHEKVSLRLSAGEIEARKEARVLTFLIFVS
jgi:hypothetical protein